jgi:hypothetical protein
MLSLLPVTVIFEFALSCRVRAAQPQQREMTMFQSCRLTMLAIFALLLPVAVSAIAVRTQSSCDCFSLNLNALSSLHSIFLALIPQLKESSCMATLMFPVEQQLLTVDDAFQIEANLAEYFDNVVIWTFENHTESQPMRVLLSVNEPIKLYVDASDAMVIDGQATVTAAVTLLYEAPEMAIPIDMATLMTRALENGSATIARNFAFSSDPSLVQFVFGAMENDTIALKVRDGSEYTPTEVGLIVVTSFLSVILVVVSSILLYVTGGWKVCKTKVTNCLFEEVDDDEEMNIVACKSTYPMQSSDEDDDNINADDNQSESHMTSVPPSSASGILGVARNRDHPATGFLSPGASDDESSMMYGDGMTPVSRQHNVPLGITSMRKLPQPDFSPDHVRGGLSGMVMQRLTRSGSKKK